MIVQEKESQARTKLTMGSAIVKLVKKVKKLEGVLKRRNVIGQRVVARKWITKEKTFKEELFETCNQRKKHFGTWKLSQLKNLSFEEVKEEFDKGMGWVGAGEAELQTKTSKRLKSDEAKDNKPTKKTGKRRKQIARKGLHTNLDKDDSEDSDDASEQDDFASGTKIPINPVPVAMKSPSIATYKIIKQGKKSVYQIVREDELYGMNGPENEFEKVLWEYLKNMFEAPLSTDPIWSLLGMQSYANKKLQGENHIKDVLQNVENDGKASWH
ncbi:hypothetical protein Tco_0072753 [Tanacetum coccineum]